MRKRPLLVLALAAELAFAADGPTGIPGVEKVLRTKEEAAAVADRLEALYKGKTQPESVRVLIAVARGTLSGEDGWFGPPQTRYDWAWLARRCGVDPKGTIPRDKFPGSDAQFAALDRDGDGRITRGDLDWSPNNPYLLASAAIGRLFRQLDAEGKGKVTKEALAAFFDRAAKGKDHLTADDLRAALGGGTLTPGDVASPETMLRSLFAVEGVKKRYDRDAEFLMVYVREAHPTDGWRVKVNDKAGVEVAQPKTDEERCGVARQCEKALKPTMPVVVDGVDDRVGDAYSGMPGRPYAIDTRGRGAYKSGRGPFGFKAGELEQALVMALLEAKGEK